MKRLFSLAALVLVLALGGLRAQQPQPLPMDKAVRYGQLPNGLTYYIRHNENPKGHCDFHIAQAVGAILEEDNQNGLAHFLEHMAFNGTKHFPGKELINYFESIGVNFGGGINAYTSTDETVYRLSNVPTTREGMLDSALLVMYDWSCALLLEDEEIDSERGVIREEWRTVSNANRRMYSGGQKIKYPGSKYAKRDVIGDTAVINNFKYNELRDYYHQWYGPDLQGIVIVGDIDVDQMEKKLVDLFSPIPERANRGVRPVFPIADNDEPIVGRYTDKEAQISRISVEFKHPALPREIKLTNQGYILSVVNDLISMMFGNRMQEIVVKPESTMLDNYGVYGNLEGVTDGMMFITIPKDGKEREALVDLLTQIEKMRRYGFTSSEFELVKTELLSAYEKQYNERNNMKNRTLAERQYIRHFIDGMPTPGIEWEYEFAKMFLPQLTVEIPNAMVKEYITEKNAVIAYVGKDVATAPTEEEMTAAFKAMSSLEIEAPVEETFDRPLVEKAPKAGKIKREFYNEELGTTEWLLSNGVNVIIKPTDFKNDEILMNMESQGGLSLVSTEDLPSGELAVSIVDNAGVGNFSLIDLRKVLTGKQVACSPSIDDCWERMSGHSAVKDFETMLQLQYLYFTAPRRDDDAYKALMSILETSLSSRESNPQTIFSDSISMTTASHHPRALIFDLNMLSKVNMDKAYEIYGQRFANPADFTVYFTGNINPADPATRRLISTWIGGLKTNKKQAAETAVDHNVRYPKGKVNNYFTRDMEINAASNRIVFTAKIDYTLSNRINTNIIGDILGIRYTESIREKEGGTYGVGTRSYLTNEPINQAIILMHFDTDPEKQQKLMSIIYKEVMDIVNDGPRADDLAKVKEDLINAFQRDMRENSYWNNTILHRYYVDGMDYANDYLNILKGVTAESVQAILKQIVEQGNVIEVVMTPNK